VQFAFRAAVSVNESHPLARDLNEILERGIDDFNVFRGARIFMTGGTGFVGTWLMESFAWANRRLHLKAKLDVLTRDPLAVAATKPHLAADESISFIRGDVRTLRERVGSYDAVVHAATPAAAKLNAEEPLLMIDTVVEGTRKALDFARSNGAVPFLFTSSGAVYGRQPPELALLDETYGGGPDPLNPHFAYHESKRLAEQLCAIYGGTTEVRPKIGRLFAFIGPHLPLDRHFAIGNFIGDALSRRPIVISGDGTSVRTYLYAADMASWLWRLLVRGEASRAYNVGSEHIISIEEAARSVAMLADGVVRIERRETPVAGKAPERYACATVRARRELGLTEWTPLEEGIRRTLAWHQAGGALSDSK